MSYLLDTDICSFIIKRSSPRLLKRVRRYRPRELQVSSVTVYELEYGARRLPDRAAEFGRVIAAFLENVRILPFDEPAAVQAAIVRAALAARGTPIGAHDTMIAGQALAGAATLVTGNVREFGRVPGLRVDSWV